MAFRVTQAKTIPSKKYESNFATTSGQKIVLIGIQCSTKSLSTFKFFIKFQLLLDQQ